MTIRYSDLAKLKHAKMIARECSCFIVEKGELDKTKYLLYRENKYGANVLIGSNSTIDAMLERVKKAAKAE